MVRMLTSLFRRLSRKAGRERLVNCLLAKTAIIRESVNPGIAVPFWASQSAAGQRARDPRSEEHTSELQSLMRISYAVFCLKKKKHKRKHTLHTEKKHYKMS